MNNSVVYNSGVNIWDRDFLSTLCVFYDEVYLPALVDTDEVIQFKDTSKSGDSLKMNGLMVKLYIQHEGKKYSAGELIKKWEDENTLLFNEGVIKRLPASKNINEGKLFDNSIYEELQDLLLDIPYKFHLKVGTSNEIGLWKDHIYHLLRNDISIPSIFLTKQQHSSREGMKTLIANCTFKYFLPSLNALHPEQLMEIRRETESNREGFSMHLQTLSLDVETRILEGDSFENIKRYAQSVAETKLIPDYFEFKRQIAAKRAGFWGNVLDKASKIAEIDSAPWTPKFYADLLKIFGFTMLAGISEQKDQLTNKSQACQFIKKVENKFCT